MATKMTNAKVDYSTMNTSDIVNTVRASVKKEPALQLLIGMKEYRNAIKLPYRR